MTHSHIRHTKKSIFLCILLSICFLFVFSSCGSSQNSIYPTNLEKGDGYGGVMLMSLIPEFGGYNVYYYCGENDTSPSEYEGIAYDPKSNTLTLTDYCNTKVKLEIRNMGSNFTINIKGSCILGGIDASDSSMRITGDGGMLMIKSFDELGSLRFYAQDKKCALMIDSVNLYVAGTFFAQSGLKQTLYYVEPLQFSDGVFFDEELHHPVREGDPSTIYGVGLYLQ